jgi:hypothetical protein
MKSLPPHSFFSSVVRFLVPLAFSSYGTFQCAQTIEIKLVNGRNGSPIAGTCVNVWVGNEHKDAMTLPTDKNGVARLRLTDNDGEIDIHNRWKDCGEFGMINPVVKYADSVRINAGYVLCHSRTSDYSWLALTDFPTKTLIQQGIVTPNTCGEAKPSEKPGEVVIVVRPLNLWEKLKQ